MYIWGVVTFRVCFFASRYFTLNEINFKTYIPIVSLMEFSASLSGAPFFYIVVAARTFHSNFFLDSADFFFARLTLMSPRWRLFFHAPRSHFTLLPLWWSRARSSRDFFLLFDFHRLFEFPVANDDDDEWNGGEKRHVARLLLLLFGWLLFSLYFLRCCCWDTQNDDEESYWPDWL